MMILLVSHHNRRYLFHCGVQPQMQTSRYFQTLVLTLLPKYSGNRGCDGASALPRSTVTRIFQGYDSASARYRERFGVVC